MTLAALVLSLSLSAATNEAQFVLDAWGTNEGLPQSSVTAILQARNGYLWLGTQGGLVRFDGLQFEVFAPATHPGLTGSRIRTLFEDRHDVLWIGTEDGGLIRYAGGVFTPVGLPQLSTITVTHIAEAGEDGLWVATTVGVFEWRADSIRHHWRLDGSPLRPQDSVVAELDGELWIGTSRGLVRLRPDGFTTYTVADGLPNDGVQALLKARDGGLWIGTSRGLARWFNGRLSSAGLPDVDASSVSALHEDSSGNLWVGTRGGVRRLSNGQFTLVPAVASQSVISLTTDREGNVWVGTVVNGLMRLKAARVAMLPVIEGQSDIAVVPIVEDRDGTMWIGGTCAGLLRYRHGERRRFTTQDGVPGCVWSLLADRDGALWIGTYGGGLTRLVNGSFETFTPRNSGLQHDIVLALYQDRRGVIWVGTRGGLHAFTNGTFTAYRTTEGLVHDDVRFITEDRHGALWIGTAGGISRFADGRFTNYTTANGLAHNSVRAIHEDAAGAIWIGTYGGGLMRLKDGRFSHLTRATGLFDDVVSRILDDGRGFLWMSGNRGIFRVSHESLNAFADGRATAVRSLSYGVTDGMTTHETNGGGQPAGWLAHDGRLWFPTIDGVAIIDPNTPDSQLPPSIVVERVTVDGRELNRAAPIVLPSGRMRLEIAYTALSLTAPEKSQFRYQLEGYEVEPVEAGTRRVAYYTNLPAGTYTFRVGGTNNDGVWNTAGATLGIEVIAPFWMTWWFRAAVAAACMLMAFSLHRVRVATLRREQRVHDAFTRKLIESQEVERARVARELHDTLGQSLVLIKNQALLGLNRAVDDRAGAITEISSMATQAIAEVKEIAYDLRPYQLDRLGLTKALEALVARVVSSTNLMASTGIANIDGLLSKEQEIMLYRIVQESFNNIVKHAGATSVEVEIAVEPSHVLARVHDDGRGFTMTPADPAHGLGLPGMHERARMLGARLEVLAAPGMGTTVTLTIPRLEGGRAH